MPGPLTGVTVVDLTRVLAGPYCTMMLAELGARVIKVENPDGGDDSRQFEPFFQGKSAYFMSLNRGKESIALNLRDAADKAVFLELVRRADVVAENFRPGTMEKLGLGYEDLKAIHPRLIYAAISGFGHTGPWREKPAYDLIVQALGGLMSVNGQPGSPPTKAGTSIGDITGGLFCLAGINSALFQRERTGRGMKIDVSMLDGQIAILESAVMRYSTSGTIPVPMGNRHPSIAPFENFATSDRSIIIAIGNDSLFVRLCQALGRPHMATDPRFQTNRARLVNIDALKDEIEVVMKREPADYWLHAFEEAGVPSCPINNIADALANPQVRARNMLVESAGVMMPGNPIKVSGVEETTTRRAAPELDEDGPRIRRELEQR